MVATKAQADSIQACIDDSETLYLSSAMANIVGDSLVAKTAVGWSSNNHTSECVDVFACGPGARRLPFFIKNYELFGIMTQALGLST
jgi:alkaline phosphatase